MSFCDHSVESTGRALTRLACGRRSGLAVFRQSSGVPATNLRVTISTSGAPCSHALPLYQNVETSRLLLLLTVKVHVACIFTYHLSAIASQDLHREYLKRDNHIECSPAAPPGISLTLQECLLVTRHSANPAFPPASNNIVHT